MESFAGPVFRPGDDGYDVERSGFNVAIRHDADYVIGATGPADVAAAIRLASATDRAVGVAATGHGPAIAADGQVLINTSRMSLAEVDPVNRVARIGAGVRWERVLRVLARYGLAPLNGSSPDVGVVGYTLGGGAGPLGRRYGFAADHVRRLEVVTADGQLRDVSPTDEPDLFWALRGGKGNFGVVVSLECELVPISRIYGGGLYFGAEFATDALHAYHEWTKDVPEEMSSSVLMGRFPPLDEVPEPLRGQFVTHVRLAYCGSPGDGERLVQPLRDIAPTLMDTMRDMPYIDVGTIYNDPTTPAPVYDKNIMLHGLDADAIDTMLSLAGPRSDAPYLIELRQLGGAYSRPPAIPSAVGGRDAEFMLFSGSVLGQDGELEKIHAAHEILHASLRPWSTGHPFVNFLGIDDANPKRVATAYDSNDYTRLAELKSYYDPTNMFRINFNIPPAHQALEE